MSATKTMLELFLILTLRWHPTSGHETTKQRIANFLEHLPDRVFTEEPLLTSGARSTLDCASICGGTPDCMSFTYTADTSSSTSCRCHRSLMTSESAFSSFSGAKAFRFDCPELFPLSHGDSCYSLSLDSLDFSSSKAACEAQGGKLAEIETSGENEALKHYIKLFGTKDDYWLGGWDVDSEGSFVWVSDNRNITFSDWAVWQPDNAGNNEDCIEIRVSYGYLWNDVPCSHSLGYICEIR